MAHCPKRYRHNLPSRFAQHRTEDGQLLVHALIVLTLDLAFVAVALPAPSPNGQNCPCRLPSFRQFRRTDISAAYGVPCPSLADNVLIACSKEFLSTSGN